MSLEKQRTLAETNPPLLFVLCLCVCVIVHVANIHCSCSGTMGSTVDERRAGGCWLACTVQRGGSGPVDSPLPESSFRLRVYRMCQLPPLLCPSLQLSQSALGTTDEVWSGPLQRVLPTPENILFFLTKHLSPTPHNQLHHRIRP